MQRLALVLGITGGLARISLACFPPVCVPLMFVFAKFGPSWMGIPVGFLGILVGVLWDNGRTMLRSCSKPDLRCSWGSLASLRGPFPTHGSRMQATTRTGSE